MSKKDEIISLFNKKLFSNKLKREDFLNRTDLPSSSGAKVFTCQFRDNCNVDESKHPIWTPALGDDDTDVMVVGEAPSAGGGPGIHIGGLFGKWENSPKSPAVPMRDWVMNNYGTIPHFTDLAKCGVERQKNKNELKKRIPNCIKYLLKEEIRIMHPKRLLCTGNTAYYFVLDLRQRNEISKDIELVKLTHYSRLASLPLSVEDKKNIIWKLEAGFLSHEMLARIPLCELSHFRRKPESE